MQPSRRFRVAFGCVLLLAGCRTATRLPCETDSDKHDNHSDLHSTAEWAVPNGDVAIARAIEYLGVPIPPVDRTQAQLIDLWQDNTPFLAGQAAGRPTWHVTVFDCRLRLHSALPELRDSLCRTIDVFLDARNGHLLTIVTRTLRGGSDIAPEPPASSAEDQMRQSGMEIYVAYPGAVPRIAFRDALDVTLQEGMGSPLEAKQIIARYVSRSAMNEAPRNVWAITLLGITPLHAAHPGVSVDARNHMRNIIDARTGKWLAATTTPQPVQIRATTTANIPYIPAEPDANEPNCPDPNAPESVTFDVSSSYDGQAVQSGQGIDWAITVTVDECAGLGLALAAVDMVQDAGNPELFDIPRGVRPVSMIDFDRPRGVSNPDPNDAPDGSDPNQIIDPNAVRSAYGGTRMGAAGARNLVEIGGAQNNFGVVGNGVGRDTTLEGGVGQQPGGQLLASGSFDAPATPGTYMFSIENAKANVLAEIREAPEFSPVREATVTFGQESFSFTVTGADCPGDLNGDNVVDLTDLGILLTDYECVTPPAAECVGDINGDGTTDLTDLGILLTNYDTTCP